MFYSVVYVKVWEIREGEGGKDDGVFSITFSLWETPAPKGGNNGRSWRAVLSLITGIHVKNPEVADMGS